MQAAILEAINKPILITKELGIPELNPGQLLIQIAYAGVCHSQLMEARGLRGEDKYLPHLFGHEATGRVVKVGNQVTRFKVGDRVILGWIKGSGIEAGGCQYRLENRVINSGAVTCFSEYSVVSENRVQKLPEGIPPKVGVLFGCALLTGAGMVKNDLKPNHGKTFAVFGLGGIGLSSLMATKLFNPTRVFAIDTNLEKLSLAKSFGATDVIQAGSVDIVKFIKDSTNQVGVDYAIEASGQAKVIEQAFEVVKRGGGTCVFASHPENGTKISLDPYELICGKKIKGSWGGGSNPDEDVPFLANLYLKKNLPLDLLVTKTYKLTEIDQALNDLQEKKVFRPILEINPTIIN